MDRFIANVDRIGSNESKEMVLICYPLCPFDIVNCSSSS